jgi:two-component system chemotaxis response regulator CheB
VVAIGASTGGPQALQTVLKCLPGDFPVPILCVQHIGMGFLDGLVGWLGAGCRLRVKVVEPAEEPRPGTVYFPQEGTHLVLDAAKRLITSLEAPVAQHRPSVTTTFRSVAARFGKTALAVLLTGMGADGAHGMLDVRRAGGVTIAQDETTCMVFGMPRQAIELGAAQHVLPLDQIGPAVQKLVLGRSA